MKLKNALKNGNFLKSLFQVIFVFYFYCIICFVTSIAFSNSVIIMFLVVNDTLYVEFIEGKAGVIIGKKSPLLF